MWIAKIRIPPKFIKVEMMDSDGPQLDYELWSTLKALQSRHLLLGFTKRGPEMLFAVAIEVDPVEGLTLSLEICHGPKEASQQGRDCQPSWPPNWQLAVPSLLLDSGNQVAAVLLY